MPLSKQAEEILAELVRFDTTSRNSNRACIDYIRDYLCTYGVASEFVANQDGSKASLWATVGDTNKTGIVLAGHTDVVPVDGQTWSSDPFTLVEHDGKFFGRGCVDMKGFLACALAVVPEFLAAQTGASFHLAFTSDEETDFSGALRLVDFLKKKNVKPSWVWLGEPTEFSIINQHKGCGAYTLRIRGVPGHSSQPEKGLSAIESMGLALMAIVGVIERKKKNPFASSSFDTPYSTINLGIVNGGTAENIIAEECALLWQIRAHPGEDAKTIVGEVEESVRSVLASRLAAFPSQASMEISELYDFPPFLGTGDNIGVRTLKKILKNAEIRAVSFATEAGVFQKLGVPVAVCGPGSIAQAHQPNEFIEKKQLSSCVDLMRLVLLSSPSRAM